LETFGEARPEKRKKKGIKGHVNLHHNTVRNSDAVPEEKQESLTENERKVLGERHEEEKRGLEKKCCNNPPVRVWGGNRPANSSKDAKKRPRKKLHW